MLKANVKLLVEKTLEPGDYLCKTIVIDTSEYPPLN